MLKHPMGMNIFTCSDIVFQILLILEMKDLSQLAQVNKLISTILRSDYFWAKRYQRNYSKIPESDKIDYRKICQYKFLHTRPPSEIYHVVFHHKPYKSADKCFNLQIKTHKKSAIYHYIAHLYNYEDFPEKQYIRMSLVQGLRKINEKRLDCDRSLISDLYDQYYAKNAEKINLEFYHSLEIDSYKCEELKNKVIYSTRGFYGTNNLSLANFGETYNNIVLIFFDFLTLHNFRLDLNPPFPHQLTSISITPSLIKKVINCSKCIILNKQNLIIL